MPDDYKTVMPDLIGHPGFECMDTRVRGYDRDMDTGLRGYDRKVGTPDYLTTVMPDCFKAVMPKYLKNVMPDLIGHPCMQETGSSGQARG
jgi:hypothetical protein